jgi:hypothetical protein
LINAIFCDTTICIVANKVIKRDPVVDEYIKKHAIRLSWSSGKLTSPDLSDEMLKELDEEWGDEEWVD